MMTTKIFYFSGTGNTLWSAKRIAERLGGGCELINIGAEMRRPAGIIEAERALVLFPAYAYQMPLLVRRFLDRCEFRAPYIAALATFGTDPGGALAEASRVLRRKGARASLFAAIPSVENYIPIFGAPTEETKSSRLALQEAATDAAARDILARKTNTVWTLRPLSACVSSLFRLGKGLFVKGFRVGSACNGCGICAKVCPAANITMSGARPVFGGRCEHCQACLAWCPGREIRYIRLGPDTPRYHHPGVTVSQMFLRTRAEIT
jgi:ferredoxin